jgi:hypothetical protein
MRRTEVWLVALLLLVQVSATQGQSDPYGRLGER